MKIARHKLETLRPTRANYVKALEMAGHWDGDWLRLPPNALLSVLKEHRPERLVRVKPQWPGARFNGPKLWAELHRRPTQYTPPNDDAWLADFKRRLPCGECKRHWNEILGAHPPDCSTRENYFVWTVTVHNLVNARLGKPQFTVAEELKTWSDSDVFN